MFAATRMIAVWSVLLCVSLMVATTPATWAATINVPRDHDTIQEAIDAASDGDEIIVAPGTYNETIEIVAKSITLRSAEGPDVTIIDGQRQGSVITIDNPTSPAVTIVTMIDGFTVTGGAGSPSGGGLLKKGVLSNDTVTTILNCHFVGNSAESGGGGIFADRTVAITDSTFTANTAGGSSGYWPTGGGGALNVVAFTIQSSTFFNNSTTGSGGAIFTREGVLNNRSVEDSAFIANTAEGRGGALHAYGTGWSASSVAVEDSLFEDNHADFGGAMYAQAGEDISAQITCTGCVFRDNTASSTGGAFENGCTFEHFSVCGKGTFVDCTFTDNSAGLSGGAIRNRCILNGDYDFWQCNSPTISGCTFKRNVAGSEGGAIFTSTQSADSPTTITDTSFCADQPQAINGPWQDDGGNFFSPPADINCDGEVDVFDLLILIGEWGECDDPNDCPADLNGDEVVDVFDLLILIGNWG